MWRYLPRLKQPWGAVHVNRWMLSNIRYRLQRWAEALNRELASLTREVLTNILYFFMTLLILTLTVTILALEVEAIVDILNALSFTLIGLIILFITAAIFMATQAAAAIGKSNEDKRHFTNSINDYPGNLYEIFERNINKYTVDETHTLLSGLAAFHVIDQASYVKFKTWLLSILPELSTDSQTWRTPYTRTYEIAQSGQSAKDWNIILSLDILNKYGSLGQREQSQLNKVRRCAVEFQSTGSQSYWEHHPFMGARLTRIVYISIFSLVLSFLFCMVFIKKPDLIAEYNFHTVEILAFITIFFMLISMLVSIRYLVLLVEYFRTTSNRSYQNQINFYPEDPSEGSYYNSRWM
jgi:hypothetical protein